MRAEYKSLQKQADHLQHRTHDCVDNSSGPMAQRVAHMARDVMEEIESDRPPRSVESRIIQLKQHLEEMKAHPTAVMSPQDARTLMDDYEDLRREVRSLPDY